MNIVKSFIVLNIAIFFSFQNIFAEDVWNGEDYQKNSSLQYQWATQYLEKLQLKGNEAILDIGCGDGRVTAALSLAVPKGSVIGIDNSPAMLKTANKLIKDHPEVKNLRFIQSNAETIPFENTFDYVVSFSCLHWILDIDAVMRGIHHSLRPSGKLFLYFAPEFGKNRLDHAIDFVVEKPQWKDYFTSFSSSFNLHTPKQVTSSLKKAGLTLTKKEVITIHESFKTKQMFSTWIKAWLPHLKFLPYDLQEKFVEEILNQYFLFHPQDQDGTCHFIDYWIEVEGMKPAL